MHVSHDAGWNGFIYVISGQGEFGGGGVGGWTESTDHHTLVLGPGDRVEAKNTVRCAEAQLFFFVTSASLPGSPLRNIE